MGKKRIINNSVPCNGCTECCQDDAIYLHPELGDKASQYETQVLDGKYALAHNEQGNCIYLKSSGCSIWDRRPAICREMDCAIFLLISDYRLREYIKGGYIRFSIIRAAEKRLKRDPDAKATLDRLKRQMRNKPKG